MSASAKPPLLVTCGIFRREIPRLGPAVLGRARPIFLDSNLHMRPARLGEALGRLARTKHRRLVLVYGDCCPHMVELGRQPHIRKVRGVNCCEIVLGREDYRQLRREGVFFLLPEWTARWEELFRVQLGLKNKSLAREFMHEMHTRIMYLDTGVSVVPHDALSRLTTFLDLPVEIRTVGLDRLKVAVQNGLEG